MKRLQRFMMRAPIALYRLHLGSLLGGRFLLLEHVGRSTGLTRRTVLEVVETMDDSPVIVSGFGVSSQWFKNVSENPDVWVTRGRSRARATAVRLDPEQARTVFDRYRVRHPRAAKAIGKRIGVSLVDDIDSAARMLPLFHLVPATGAPLHVA